MTDVGLVVADLLKMRVVSRMEALVRRAQRDTPPGRVLAVLMPMPKLWNPSIAYEELVHRVVLPVADMRSNSEEWEYFGNLAVRGCRLSEGRRVIEAEVGVALYRRAGEKAYRRRHSLTEDILESSVLPTLHPVFTRDVANNVWHLEGGRLAIPIVERLGALLAWSDETILLLRGRSRQVLTRKALALDSGLVGKPEKVDYEWAMTQTRLPF